MDENEISKVIVDAAIEVHRTLGGPGLLEGVYQEAEAWELLKRGMEVERENIIPIIYKGHQLGFPCAWICWSTERLLWSAKSP